MSFSSYFNDNTSYLSLQSKINRMSKKNSRNLIKERKIQQLDIPLKERKTYKKNPSSQFIRFQKVINNILNTEPNNHYKNHYSLDGIDYNENNIQPPNPKIIKEKNNNYLFGFNPTLRSKKIKKKENFITHNFEKINNEKFNYYNKDKAIQFLHKVNSFNSDLKQNISKNNFIDKRNTMDIMEQNIKNECFNKKKYTNLFKTRLIKYHKRSLSDYETNDNRYDKLREYYLNYQNQKAQNNNFIINSVILKDFNNSRNIKNYKNSFNIK